MVTGSLLSAPLLVPSQGALSLSSSSSSSNGEMEERRREVAGEVLAQGKGRCWAWKRVFIFRGPSLTRSQHVAVGDGAGARGVRDRVRATTGRAPRCCSGRVAGEHERSRSSPLHSAFFLFPFLFIILWDTDNVCSALSTRK
jgi:hypothetical protein